MTANRLDLRRPQAASPDLPGLRAYLAPLVGEPFRFARVSYGDELTLHFGDLRPARSPKLRGRPYGAYVLGVRASRWLLKGGSGPQVLAAGVDLGDLPAGFGTPVGNPEVEADPLIPADTPVVSATPFVVRPVDGLGLQLRVADGSTLLILPAGPEADEPGDESLPEIADWELSSPGGLLRAGPGLTWSFDPRTGSD